jgi:type I restriction enzyme S subunit
LLDDVAYVNPPETAEGRRTLVQSGDVLLSITADLGRTAVVPEEIGDAYINQHLAILRVKGVEPRFLSAFLSSPFGQTQIQGRNRGGVKAGLNFDDINSFTIPLPPLPEQRRIAEILDRAEALRAQRRAAIAQLDELTQAIFIDMFGDLDTHLNSRQLPKGWKVDAVADICAPRPYSCVGGPFGSELTQADYVDVPGIPVVRGQNLSSNGMFIFEEGFVFVSESKANELHRNTAERGDVMVSQRGARLAGQVAYIPLTSKFPRYVVSQSQMKISPDLNRVHPFYLVHYFQSPQAIRIMEAQTISTGVPHINLGILRKFKVVVPPLELQSSFAARITAISKLRSAYRTSLAELDALFGTLQNRAFCGEL